VLLVVNEHLPVRSGGNNQDFYFEKLAWLGLAQVSKPVPGRY
jgi:hypothetical protein